jgi:hypothetical protein
MTSSHGSYIYSCKGIEYAFSIPNLAATRMIWGNVIFQISYRFPIIILSGAVTLKKRKAPRQLKIFLLETDKKPIKKQLVKSSFTRF